MTAPELSLNLAASDADQPAAIPRPAIAGPSGPLKSCMLRAWAGITAATVFAPVSGALFTLLFYLQRESWTLSTEEVLWLGVAGAAAGWAIVAFTLALRATPRGANPVRGSDIAVRLETIRDNLDRVDDDATAEALSRRGQSWCQIKEELLREIAAVQDRLDTPSAEWFTGNGFLATWRVVNRIEVEMLQYVPCEQVVSEAFYDLGRLKNSGIDDGGTMSRALKAAIVRLDSSMGPYLRLQFPEPGDNDTDPAADDAGCDDSALAARRVVAQVRHTINDYRAGNWGLVARLKQQFLMAAVSLMAVTYVLTVLAVIQRAPDQALVGGVVFFAVGAMAGLFAQLVVNRDDTSIVDDYGYSDTRLAFTPLVSGFAALLGVWTLATSGALTLGATADPETVNAAANATPRLTQVFDFAANGAALVVAAAFGIAPAAAINRIQQGVIDAKQALVASGSSGAAHPAPDPRKGTK